MVSHQHDIGPVSIVPIVSIEVVVFASTHIGGDFHPRAGMVVVPPLIFRRTHLHASCIDSPEETLMVLEELWILVR